MVAQSGLRSDMHVALTGASGFIGSVLARHLQASGHTVAALVRPTSKRDHIADVVDRFVVGDQEDFGDLLEGADAVIHNAVDWRSLKTGDLETHYRANLLGAVNLIEASAPRPFVFMSTIAVHHDMRPRWEGAIDEDHPSRPGTRYGALKAAIEAHLFAARYGEERHTVSLRPCAVYGIDPDRGRSIGAPILESIRDGKPYARKGGGKFVHVDDVAAATVAALERDDAPPVVNLADCYARWSDWAQMAAEILGVEADIEVNSPPDARNTFSKDAAASLGVPLDRGQAGIRDHLAHLAGVMELC